MLQAELKLKDCPTVPVAGTSAQAIGAFIQLVNAKQAIMTKAKNLTVVFIFITVF